MFAFKIFIASTIALSCNALALDNSAFAFPRDHTQLLKTHIAQVLKSRDIKCKFGEPFKVTNTVLDSGAEVQRWSCKLSPEELAAAHEQNEDDFKLYDTRGLSVPETSLSKRQHNACGFNCPTYCYGGR